MPDDNEDIQEDNKRNLASELHGFHQYRSERCQIIPEDSFGIHASEIKPLRKSFPLGQLHNVRLETKIWDGNGYFKRLNSKRDMPLRPRSCPKCGPGH